MSAWIFLNKSDDDKISFYFIILWNKVRYCLCSLSCEISFCSGEADRLDVHEGMYFTPLSPIPSPPPYGTRRQSEHTRVRWHQHIQVFVFVVFAAILAPRSTNFGEKYEFARCCTTTDRRWTMAQRKHCNARERGVGWHACAMGRGSLQSRHDRVARDVWYWSCDGVFPCSDPSSSGEPFGLMVRWKTK